MGIQARRFVEYLRAAGQSHWQVLPLNPPARGDSPYSAYSVFAGNPYFIDLPNQKLKLFGNSNDFCIKKFEKSEKIKMDGHTVTQKGKRYFVEDYENSLADC